MSKRSLNWETEFWHYVSTGDGVSCPVYQHCSMRVETGKCSCPMYNPILDGRPTGSFCCLNEEISPCFGKENGSYLCNSSNLGFMEKLRPGRIFELLQLLSQSWIKIGGVESPPVPIDLVQTMDRSCPIDIRTIPMKAYAGAIWKTKEGWVIYVNANDCIATQRLTLFHEAFHILAHCKATPVFRKRGSDKGAFNELLADNFALHILMPRQWFEKRWEEHKDTVALAEQFQVSESAVVKRLESLSLI